MKRLQRLSRVRDVMRAEERRLAQRLAEFEQRLLSAEQRTLELQRYRADYAQQLERSGVGGLNVSSLRNYQIFLARLDEAIRQQEQIKRQTSTELEFNRRSWQEAAIRLKSLASVIGQWEDRARQARDRIDQSESDERALRSLEKSEIQYDG